jgi:hypothetical protein
MNVAEPVIQAAPVAAPPPTIAPAAPAPPQSQVNVGSLKDVLDAASQRMFDVQRAAQLGIQPPPDPQDAPAEPAPGQPPVAAAQAPAGGLSIEALANPELLPVLEAIVNTAKAKAAPAAPAEPEPQAPAAPDWNARSADLRTRIAAEMKAQSARSVIVERPDPDTGEMKRETRVEYDFDPDSFVGKRLVDAEVREAVRSEMEKHTREVNNFNRQRREKQTAAQKQAEEQRAAKAFETRIASTVDAFIGGNMLTADGRKTSEFIPKDEKGVPQAWVRSLLKSTVDGIRHSPDFAEAAEKYAQEQLGQGQSYEAIQRGIAASLMSRAFEVLRPALTISGGSTIVPSTSAKTGAPPAEQVPAAKVNAPAVPANSPTSYPTMPAAPVSPDAKPTATQKALSGGLGAMGFGLQQRLVQEANQRLAEVMRRTQRPPV